VITAAVSSSVSSSCVLATYGGGQRSPLRQAVDSYMARGRRFGGLDDEALQHRFVMACPAWCAPTACGLQVTCGGWLARALPFSRP